jgi:hypothetical protein
MISIGARQNWQRTACWKILKETNRQPPSPSNSISKQQKLQHQPQLDLKKPTSTSSPYLAESPMLFPKNKIHCQLKVSQVIIYLYTCLSIHPSIYI